MILRSGRQTTHRLGDGHGGYATHEHPGSTTTELRVGIVAIPNQFVDGADHRAADGAGSSAWRESIRPGTASWFDISSQAPR